MKIFISADIEGVTGVTDWSETELGQSAWEAAREQMTAEVAAACEGAMAAGAQEIWIKDSHDSARNLIADRLPQCAKLIRGWTGHPFQTLAGLDSSFAAVLLIGYHSGAGFGKSPLEHTWSGHVMCIKLNGVYASEFLTDAGTCALVGVPLAFVSGDRGLCDSIRQFNPAIGCLAVKEGVGSATVNIHPQLAVEQIRAGTAAALQSDLARCRIPLPEHFTMEIRYRSHARAYQYGFFPGARQTDTFTVQLETDNYFDVLRLLMFAVA